MHSAPDPAALGSLVVFPPPYGISIAYLNLYLRILSNSLKEHLTVHSALSLSFPTPICPSQQEGSGGGNADKRRQKPIFVMMHVGNVGEEVRVRWEGEGTKKRNGGEEREKILQPWTGHCTENGEKRISSKAEPVQAIKSAVA